MIEDLEPYALGELGLTPQQFGDYTITELYAMMNGWKRRMKSWATLLYGERQEMTEADKKFWNEFLSKKGAKE